MSQIDLSKLKRYESFNAGVEEWDGGQYVLYDDVMAQLAAQEPAGWLWGNHYYERDNPRLTDNIKDLGRPLYAHPAPAAIERKQGEHKIPPVPCEKCGGIYFHKPDCPNLV